MNGTIKVDGTATNKLTLAKGIKKTFTLNIWKYAQETGSSTFCVTGEESTCLPINPDTFEVGTIIKYKVNAATEKYFHVIPNNGDTLTIQQRENIVYSTAWYTEVDDNPKGSIAILSALEGATKEWTNVLDQTYTLGTTLVANMIVLIINMIV